MGSGRFSAGGWLASHVTLPRRGPVPSSTTRLTTAPFWQLAISFSARTCFHCVVPDASRIISRAACGRGAIDSRHHSPPAPLPARRRHDHELVVDQPEPDWHRETAAATGFVDRSVTVARVSDQLAKRVAVGASSLGVGCEGEVRTETGVPVDAGLRSSMG